LKVQKDMFYHSYSTWANSQIFLAFYFHRVLTDPFKAWQNLWEADGYSKWHGVPTYTHVMRIIKNKPQSDILKLMSLYCGKYDPSLHSVAAIVLFRFMISRSHFPLVM